MQRVSSSHRIPAAFIALGLLTACQQPAAQVSYRDAQAGAGTGSIINSDTGFLAARKPGDTAANDAPPVKQPAPPGDRSGPVNGAYAGNSAGMAPASNATLPVDYARRPNNGAGSQAASYYTANPMMASRVGAPATPYAQPTPASFAATPFATLSAQTAPSGSAAHAYAPIPLAPTPFGKPSAPLPPSQPAYAMATNSGPLSVSAPAIASGAPPLSAPLMPGMPNPYAGIADTPMAAPAQMVVAPLLAAQPVGQPVGMSNDYAGSYAFGGATPLAPPAAIPASSPVPAPRAMVNNDVMMNGAAPSLAPVPEAGDGASFQLATTAPVSGGIQATPVAGSAEPRFVIDAQSGAKADDLAQTMTAGGNAASSGAAGGGALTWPLRGTILSKFGPKAKGKSNDGINIAAPAGTPIHAAADGMVIYAGNEVQGYGNMLVLSHDARRATVYAHAQKLKVKKGDFVRQGQTIALVGQTGGVSQPQLHFALREGNAPLDPLPLLERGKFAGVE